MNRRFGKLTFGNVWAQLGIKNMTISKDSSGEYRVNFRNGTEKTAYYTTDLEDALGTGFAMHENRMER